MELLRALKTLRTQLALTRLPAGEHMHSVEIADTSSNECWRAYTMRLVSLALRWTTHERRCLMKVAGTIQLFSGPVLVALSHSVPCGE
jgi:hypothetical protein